MTTAAILTVIVVGVLALAIWPQRKRSAGTRVQTPAERKAQWKIRLGQHLADEILKNEARAQAFDARAIVRPVVRPKLPKDNVVNIRARKTA